MDKRDLLFEIGTEEIPALSVDAGIAQLKEEAIALCGRNRLDFNAIDTLGTPRRLTLLIRGLAEAQREEVVEMKGPPKAAAFDSDGNPTKAAEGFAASQRVTLADLSVKEEGGREYVYARRHELGRPAVEILPRMLADVVGSLTFPKAMRWGSGEMRFVRPIRWLLALYGETVIECSVDGLTSANVTYGHRFLSDNPIAIKNPEEYSSLLEKGRVIVDHERRSSLIREAISKAPLVVGGRTLINEKTFEEVVNLVEYPSVVFGSFDEEFVKLPRDILTTAMESHQRYFPVEAKDGGLHHYFVIVHNGDPDEDELIRKGHERVIRARLADARFFVQEDSKRPLDTFVENLKGVVFQEKLGTVYEKTERIRTLAGRIAALLGLDAETTGRIERAAYLSKADLTAEAVVEFPSLQGAMGREYALLSGEDEAVARAIFEHYMPRFAADAFPATIEGQVTAFADKLDTIAGALAVGLIPTGSEDPYALRRSAFGLLGIALNGGWRISLTKVVEEAIALYHVQGVSFDPAAARTVVVDFITNRLRAFLIGEGLPFDAVDAVLAIGADDLVDSRRRAIILDQERESKQMEDVLFAFNRAKNLAKPELGIDVEEALFQEGVEGELLRALLEVESKLDRDISEGDYAAAIGLLSTLRAPIDDYFEGVLVMVDDIRVRENRLRLLNKARQDFLTVADFAKLVVPAV